MTTIPSMFAVAVVIVIVITIFDFPENPRGLPTSQNFSPPRIILDDEISRRGNVASSISTPNHFECAFHPQVFFLTFQSGEKTFKLGKRFGFGVSSSPSSKKYFRGKGKIFFFTQFQPQAPRLGLKFSENSSSSYSFPHDLIPPFFASFSLLKLSTKL